MMNFFRNRPNTKPYEDIALDEYRSRFDGSESHTLIDVRTTQEFSQGHLPDAVNIPLEMIGTCMKDIPRSKPIVLVCQTGNRSGMAARQLANAGYTELFNLRGGTVSWRMRGLPLER